MTWSIGDAAIATVTPGDAGHATIQGVNVGTTTVTAAGEGITGTVTVDITPAVLTVAITSGHACGATDDGRRACGMIDRCYRSSVAARS